MYTAQSGSLANRASCVAGGAVYQCAASLLNVHACLPQGLPEEEMQDLIY